MILTCSYNIRIFPGINFAAGVFFVGHIMRQIIYPSPYCISSALIRDPYNRTCTLSTSCPQQIFPSSPSSPNSRLKYISYTACVKFCESSQLISTIFNRSCSLCNFIKYTAISSSGFHGKSVSFKLSFFYVFFNGRHCLLIWLSISFAVLCVKSSTFSSISSIHNLL